VNEIDVAIIRELPSQDFRLDRLFELHAMDVKSFEAFLRRRGLAEEALEEESWRTNCSPVFANHHTEFDASIVGIPSNIFIREFERQHISQFCKSA